VNRILEAFGIVQTLRLLAHILISLRLDIFAFYSPILSLVFRSPTSGLYPFVIVCKECQQNIPAPVETVPDSWIIAACPLCGEQRRYLPIDIFQGRLSHNFLAKAQQAGGDKWAR
jgi:hypothetical protein